MYPLAIASVLFLLTGPALAQDNHTVEVLEDGSVEIRPIDQSGEPAGQYDALAQIDAGALKEWFAVTNPDGGIQAYIGLPEGGVINAGVLTDLKPGQAVVKTEMPSFFGMQPPSPEQVRDLIGAMVESAILAVCDLGPARPTTWGTAVDVSAGFGITGTIQFSAEWETEKLCQAS